jgi:hypothetical protein
MSERPLKRLRLLTQLNPVRIAVVGLLLLLVLGVLSRAPSDAPQPVNAAETAAAGPLTEPTAGVDGDSAEPPLAATGCFRSGSSRAEVRAVMGAPDTVDFGAWMYGRSSVTFGYGVVLDYSNQGDNLRLC